MKWLGLMLVLACHALPALAAYRVFRLKIIYYDEFGKPTGHTRIVDSTLDHLQYEHYHAGFRRMEVRLTDTWFCPGDTRRRDYCEKPRVRDRAPSSLRNEPNRVELPYSRQPFIPQ